MNTATRTKEVIHHVVSNKIALTRENVITQSLFTPGGTLTENNKEIIDRQIGYYQLEQDIKAKFKHLSNSSLVKRINSLPDFKWDDEGYELTRRINASNGKFSATMQGNNIVILKDEA